MSSDRSQVLVLLLITECLYTIQFGGDNRLVHGDQPDAS
jgi:hypothetical protein